MMVKAVFERNVLICGCDDFKENIDQINTPFALAYTYSGYVYKGKKFTNCPWCGEKLEKQDTFG